MVAAEIGRSARPHRLELVDRLDAAPQRVAIVAQDLIHSLAHECRHRCPARGGERTQPRVLLLSELDDRSHHAGK